ncbi:N-glycosylase/DNA lyase [Cryptococcus neoformans]|nr:N-glycosylase/DNA lyase [Cryptococcus neoformans var. grubii Th84]OXH16900.1 N-glycosylase/DNA lyase [Cryptococcus neoformans var. grubii]OXH36871.1 N-glycosylase/DNA lyase [Cryptococcus neoformans var. grubii]OXH57847.1 N-glycosylase/DNA lyase [Cryptococcus neoformans var. grubii]OXH58230.1 N-glycosylase/DNA lyase [Cryptococcus neoformans var. grubii]
MSMSRPPFPAGWASVRMDPRNLSLANTLPVGQAFLWHRLALPATDPPFEEYSRAVHSPPRVVCLRQSPTHIYYTAVYPPGSAPEPDRSNHFTRQWLEDYFQLVRYPDLETLYLDWRRRDPELFGKVHVNDRATGVRVLRQDPWECLLAFITSTNNHIPRITSLLHKFSQSFTEPVLTLKHPSNGISIPYHLFPAPHQIPTTLEKPLRDMGFGYRAPFIEASLQMLRNKFGDKEGDIEAGLVGWRNQDVDIVRENLIALKGVGRKVADCVMLMCLDKPSLIPIDTHVAHIAARHPAFPSRLKNKAMSKQVYEETQEFLLDRWGPMGGWCQAVLFAADLPQSQGKIKVKTKVESVVKTAVKTETSLDSVDHVRRKRKESEEEKSPALKRTRSATMQAKQVIVGVDIKYDENTDR